MRPLRCAIGRHDWGRCRCSRCAAARPDAAHEWDSCRCVRCREPRPDPQHVWDGCVCTVCRADRHAFAAVDAGRHRCERCGREEPHRLVTRREWVDDGGWDSVGPWSEQQYDIESCDRCGYERSSTPTGYIRL